MNTTNSNHYPRSLPYQPPKSPAPQRARWRPSRRQLLIGGAAVFLLLGVIAGVAFSRNSPAPAPVDKPARPHERVLETLGGLSAAHLYQSYLNIGLLADAVENETYLPEDAFEMLKTVVGLMDVIDKQLDRLAKNDLTAEDKHDVERIRALAGLLRLQVAALQAYWQTGEQHYAARYHDNRDKAWKGLSEMLGL